MANELEEILKLADDLGKKVGAHPAIAKYKAAQKAVSEDTEARALLGDFDRMISALGEQEARGMSVSDAQRLQLETMQSKIVSNLKIKALNIAQVDFMNVLRQVSAAWQKHVGISQGGESPAGPRIAGR